MCNLCSVFKFAHSTYYFQLTILKIRQGIVGKGDILMSIDKYETLNQERKIQHTKRKVAAYCRVSTDNEDQANSFESQQRYFSLFAEHTEPYICSGPNKSRSGCSRRSDKADRSPTSVSPEGTGSYYPRHTRSYSLCSTS